MQAGRRSRLVGRESLAWRKLWHRPGSEVPSMHTGSVLILQEIWGKFPNLGTWETTRSFCSCYPNFSSAPWRISPFIGKSDTHTNGCNRRSNRRSRSGDQRFLEALGGNSPMSWALKKQWGWQDSGEGVFSSEVTWGFISVYLYPSPGWTEPLMDTYFLHLLHPQCEHLIH